MKILLEEIEAGKVEFTKDSEDIHMNMEVLLTERIGATGKRLHTARSRNDQVAVDFRLYVKEEIPHIITMLVNLEKALVRQAEANLDAIMPGYTHLQRAQPITFAHCDDGLRQYVPPGHHPAWRTAWSGWMSAPLAPAPWRPPPIPVDRFRTAELLGFKKPMDNSLDGVSDRDFALEFLSACSILMMHLSRFSEELILWCSWEFKFIELDDAYATGSSIMPQKKNPDVAELVRGKTGRVYGSLITLLTAMKGLPLAYNKDMQEDKEPVFDAIDTVELCLPVFAAMIDTLTVQPRQHAQGRQRRLHQRHGLRRLPGQEGHALPGGLQASSASWWATASIPATPWRRCPWRNTRRSRNTSRRTCTMPCPWRPASTAGRSTAAPPRRP